MKQKLKTYNVVIERDSEGWYVASVPGLPGFHTQAHSMDKLSERIEEVLELCQLEVPNIAISAYARH